MPEFAIVIVIHNSAAELSALLESLQAADPVATEVVVVDAGSTDGGLAIAADRGCTTTDAGDVGFGAANNAGLALVSSPITVLLNPDVVVSDADSLGRLAVLAGGTDALHFPRLLNDDGSIQDSAHRLPGRLRELPLSIVPQRVGRPPWMSSHRREVGWAIAAAVAARTETLRRLGPFDPAQFLFFEDLDLCLRARAAGIPSVLHPSIRLVHTGGHSTTRAYDGEPLELLAQRRREVIGANLGERALRLDDSAQALTFASRSLFKQRARRQLAALRRAQAGDRAPRP